MTEQGFNLWRGFRYLTAWSTLTPAVLSVTILIATPCITYGAPVLHQDVKDETITEGLDGTWGVTSRLNITSAHPHTTPVGGKFEFQSTNIFTGTADLFDPLFLPGSRIGRPDPVADMDLDNSGVYDTDLTLTGPAVFDYSMPWSIRVQSNRTTFNVVEFTFGANIEPSLSLGPAEVSLGGVGASVTVQPTQDSPPLFETEALANQFSILTTPTSDGLGFFSSAGRIVINGFARDTAPGTSRLLYDNPHWLSGEGFLVDDFTRANDPGVVITRVFDENISVPEPSSLLLFVFGLGGVAVAVRRGPH